MFPRLRIFLVLYGAIAFFPLLYLPANETGGTEFLQLQNLTGIRGGNLVLAVPAGPTNFNQMLTSGLANSAIADRISADLVHINRSSLELEPSLATRWEADKTGRIYTIHLRRGVRFSDGSGFTADDVVFTFQMLSDPDIQSSMAGQLEIDGAFPSVKKIDNLTVQISFQRPVGMGLRMLDSIPMLPKRKLYQAYREGRFSDVWGPNVRPEDVVGLGPFRLKAYQQEIKVVLERNPYYWKKDRSGQTLPYLDTITFLILSNLNSQALRFQQGELDTASFPSLNPDNYAMLRRTQEKYTLRDLGPGLMMNYLWFNLNRGVNSAGKSYVDPEIQAIFEAPEFRRAISHALDRNGMARSIYLGLGVPQYGPVSTGNKQWHYRGIDRTEYNPKRAGELLAQIGLRDTDGDGILEFGKNRPLEWTLFTSRDNGAREKIAQVIQDNLLKIGIRISIQHFLPGEIASRFLHSFEYEAILFGLTPTDVTPDLQTDLWHSSGRIHLWDPNQERPERPWEASIDSLISKLVRSLDPAARKAVFNQAQEIWTNQMPAIPIVAPNILVGWSNRLGNIRPSILAPHLIWNAEEITKGTTR
jgi:peptide/nickel transport system substrate-binding protein